MLNKKFKIYTLGCKINQYDSAYLKNFLINSGFKYKENKPKAAYVHRLVLSAFKGTGDSSMCCAHLDGNKLNNNYKNLKWSTRSENEIQKSGHGTSNLGERNGSWKLSFKDVLRIRRLYAKTSVTKGNSKYLSEKFNVSRLYILAIARNEKRKFC